MKATLATMRVLMLATGVLVPASAMACMPNQSISAQAAREEEYWAGMKDVTGFVYGVVEEEIASNHAKGVLRVLHVYRGGIREGGSLEVGQRLRMRLIPGLPNCLPPPPGTIWKQARESYGVIPIRKPLEDGVFGFYGFMSESRITMLMSARMIFPAPSGRLQDMTPFPVGTPDYVPHAP